MQRRQCDPGNRLPPRRGRRFRVRPQSQRFGTAPMPDTAPGDSRALEDSRQWRAFCLRIDTQSCSKEATEGRSAVRSITRAPRHLHLRCAGCTFLPRTSSTAARAGRVSPARSRSERPAGAISSWSCRGWSITAPAAADTRAMYSTTVHRRRASDGATTVWRLNSWRHRRYCRVWSGDAALSGEMGVDCYGAREAGHPRTARVCAVTSFAEIRT